MLELKNIVKKYSLGDNDVMALNGVSLRFRKSEFVSVLGPSGCGKTTLLNVIGGLDKYTEGDLIINGKSTKDYKDRDFDTYRNHSIGFVFQNYNLIPHQTILSNVELALTLSGVSVSERKKRAIDALKSVGLEKEIKKKPSQLSGGQMQRVAIARALVNNPDILLADEPTGALDSETSVQIMEILKEVASSRLVIMVTHNPDLADQYSTRIVKILDGRILSDSNPYSEEEYQADIKSYLEEKEKSVKNDKRKKEKGTSMSFFTAISLSFNNLMTKKARTFLTSFAGSIGIIGIALILSVSTGVNNYIDSVQEDTLVSYPLTIKAESDMLSVLGNFMSMQKEEKEIEHEDGYIYSRNVMADMMTSMTKTETNNLEKFKVYLDGDETVKKCAKNVIYDYNIDLNMYIRDEEGKIINSDMQAIFTKLSDEMSGGNFSISSTSSFSQMGSFEIWDSLLPGEDGELISPIVRDQYELLGDSRWPENYDEAVIVVSKNCEISDYVLYSLGMKPFDEMVEVMKSVYTGKEVEQTSSNSWRVDDIIGKEFRLIVNTDKYQKQADGTYIDLTKTDTGLDYLFKNDSTSVPVRIVGVIKPTEDSDSGMLKCAVAYTSKLKDYVIDKTNNSEIVKAQMEDKDTDVITGKPFLSEDARNMGDDEKGKRFSEYLSSLPEGEKASLIREIMSTPTDEYVSETVDSLYENSSREEITEMMIETYSAQMGITDTTSVREYLEKMGDGEFEEFFKTNAKDSVIAQYSAATLEQLSSLDDQMIIAQFDSTDHQESELAMYYDRFMPSEFSENTYEEIMLTLGYVDPAKPSAINIYVSSFADKDKITEAIEAYNASASEEDQIKYTDYFELLMSSISTVISAISYVLIAFVAISLVVSSIMIGIITYISVLERTKEIGILRAIGASKKDISRVFNAETITVGFVAGVLGILVSLLLILPINAIIHALTKIPTLSAALPITAAVILVGISILLTFIAGLFPSRIAAKKDPVIALRTE